MTTLTTVKEFHYANREIRRLTKTRLPVTREEWDNLVARIAAKLRQQFNNSSGRALQLARLAVVYSIGYELELTLPRPRKGKVLQ
jgi:hypothetical protein